MFSPTGPAQNSGGREQFRALTRMRGLFMSYLPLIFFVTRRNYSKPCSTFRNYPHLLSDIFQVTAISTAWLLTTTTNVDHSLSDGQSHILQDLHSSPSDKYTITDAYS